MKINSIINSSIKVRSLRNSLLTLLKEFDLTLGELEILYALRDGQAQQPSHVASTLKHERATVSRLIKQLHLKKLLDHERSLEDRRQVSILLTSEGKGLITKILAREI